MMATDRQINSGNEELDREISNWLEWDKVSHALFSQLVINYARVKIIAKRRVCHSLDYQLYEPQL